ncbi:hypothetical protein K488DRAFT_75103 [Vararia minispora EC-137]|uniref:Uncharacterized protein n=1 Tax=Vararia minispora EC-137 TaxID=1314806 RepID=A0ACB8Q4Y7_9AGAM|nr:hypothetical protein K488DRAFT_75103 [Vararia minispora EC-137]
MKKYGFYTGVLILHRGALAVRLLVSRLRRAVPRAGVTGNLDGIPRDDVRRHWRGHRGGGREGGEGTTPQACWTMTTRPRQKMEGRKAGEAGIMQLGPTGTKMDMPEAGEWKGGLVATCRRVRAGVCIETAGIGSMCWWQASVHPGMEGRDGSRGWVQTSGPARRMAGTAGSQGQARWKSARKGGNGKPGNPKVTCSGSVKRTLFLPSRPFSCTRLPVSRPSFFILRRPLSPTPPRTRLLKFKLQVPKPVRLHAPGHLRAWSHTGVLHLSLASYPSPSCTPLPGLIPKLSHPSLRICHPHAEAA